MIVECVPNISEGRDAAKISRILLPLVKNNSIKGFHVDSNADANRTVVSYAVSYDEAIHLGMEFISAVFSEVDMRQQSGVHPRIGAVDVFPFIPLLNTSIEDCMILAREFAKRAAQKFDLPVFLYAEAAKNPANQRLSEIRRKEYEGLGTRLLRAEIIPDYGPKKVNAEKGGMAVGARDILIAYNINLASKDISLARKIASQIREGGKHGLKSVRAIGWSMEGYSNVQVSMNITDFRSVGLYDVFSACTRVAHGFGVELSGSELIGLLPWEAISDTYQKFSGAELKPVKKDEMIELVVSKLGLNSVNRFEPAEQILEKCFFLD